MIIDFHTHMFPDKIAKPTIEALAKTSKKGPQTDGTYKGLLASAHQAGIDINVALPVVTKPSQFHSIAQFARRYQEGEVLSFGGVHPKDPNARESLKTLKEMGFKGIKLHPDYQDAYFNDICYKRIVDWASELGFIITVHAGMDPKCPDDIHCTPQMALEVIREVQPEKLVLAHLGCNQDWDAVEKYLVGEPVYLDTAVTLDHIEEAQFIRIARNHGTDRILFATDSPWSGQKECVDILKNMELTDEEKEQIFSGNARRLLGI